MEAASRTLEFFAQAQQILDMEISPLMLRLKQMKQELQDDDAKQQDFNAFSAFNTLLSLAELRIATDTALYEHTRWLRALRLSGVALPPDIDPQPPAYVDPPEYEYVRVDSPQPPPFEERDNGVEFKVPSASPNASPRGVPFAVPALDRNNSNGSDNIGDIARILGERMRHRRVALMQAEDDEKARS